TGADEVERTRNAHPRRPPALTTQAEREAWRDHFNARWAPIPDNLGQYRRGAWEARYRRHAGGGWVLTFAGVLVGAGSPEGMRVFATLVDVDDYVAGAERQEA